MIYAATAPLPDQIDEILFSGFCAKLNWSKASPWMSKCLPTHISLSRVTSIPPSRCAAGPFGDHTGFYSLADDYPVFHVTCITHRKNPVYPTTIVGRPPMEDAYLGKTTERLFLPLVRVTLPEIVDMHLPVHGVFHNLAIISIKKSIRGMHGR